MGLALLTYIIDYGYRCQYIYIEYIIVYIVHMNYTHAFVVNKVNTMKVISIILVSLISVRF